MNRKNISNNSPKDSPNVQPCKEYSWLLVKTLNLELFVQRLLLFTMRENLLVFCMSLTNLNFFLFLSTDTINTEQNWQNDEVRENLKVILPG